MPEEKDTIVSKKNGGAEACYNIAEVEYSHVFNRSDKLDNKVYIALTFCAFIFIFVMDLLNAIMNFKYPTDISQLVLIVMYVILCFLTIGIFIYILIKLATLVIELLSLCGYRLDVHVQEMTIKKEIRYE